MCPRIGERHIFFFWLEDNWREIKYHTSGEETLDTEMIVPTRPQKRPNKNRNLHKQTEGIFFKILKKFRANVTPCKWFNLRLLVTT